MNKSFVIPPHYKNIVGKAKNLATSYVTMDERLNETRTVSMPKNIDVVSDAFPPYFLFL